MQHVDHHVFRNPLDIASPLLDLWREKHCVVSHPLYSVAFHQKVENCLLFPSFRFPSAEDYIFPFQADYDPVIRPTTTVSHVLERTRGRVVLYTVTKTRSTRGSPRSCHYSTISIYLGRESR